EDLGRRVDLADVDQPARTELEFQEALAIGAQRDLVVDAEGHVAEMRGRNVLAADRLEIEDVDRLLGRFDELFGAHGRPHQGIGELAPGRKPFAGEGVEPSGGEQRTSGQELQEFAPAGGVSSERRHGEPSLKSNGPTRSNSFGWRRRGARSIPLACVLRFYLSHRTNLRFLASSGTFSGTRRGAPWRRRPRRRAHAHTSTWS